MKKTVIASLIFGFLGIAAAQTIENAPGVTDPVKLKLVGSYSNSYGFHDLGYTFNEVKYSDGSKSAKIQSLALKLLKQESPETYTYEIYSKTGSPVSTNIVSKNTFLRLQSILKQASVSTFAAGNECFVDVEIDRTSLQMTKVTPSCDDLQ